MLSKNILFVRYLLTSALWLCLSDAWAQHLLQDPNKQAPLQPEVQLASVYQTQDVKHYLVSEKYDGIRAIWKDKTLRTRNGNIIYAPSWFTEKLGNISLDGELWIARNSFEKLSSIVRKKTPNDNKWRQVKYMVFDAPDYQNSFAQRYDIYKSYIAYLSLPHVIAVKQSQLDNNQQLMNLLNDLSAKGGEGLMLHHKKAMFESGRTKQLLKLKTYNDAEAIIIGHTAGKGKYANMLGALVVETSNAKGQVIRFKIGSGISDAMRQKPPDIGTRITYKYYGLTANGLPKFASFVRIHKQRSKTTN